MLVIFAACSFHMIALLHLLSLLLFPCLAPLPLHADRPPLLTSFPMFIYISLFVFCAPLFILGTRARR